MEPTSHRPSAPRADAGTCPTPTVPESGTGYCPACFGRPLVMPGLGPKPTIEKGGNLDRHPIALPALLFSLCWLPYVAVFFRSSIAFGGVGGSFATDTVPYWVLLAVQLAVCVVSHSLTIRTIVRLYAPRWLIWGSIAFFCLSPAWCLMTAADIRHPLFAAVFCVFVSSLVFVLYTRQRPAWLWVQLGLGALCVCLLREGGFWSVIPALALAGLFLLWLDRGGSVLAWIEQTPAKRRESRWSDTSAAFLTLAAVTLLFLFSCGLGQATPLGQPDFGAPAAAAQAASPAADGAHAADVDGNAGALGEAGAGNVAAGEARGANAHGNLAGSGNVAGVLPFAQIESNSVFPQLAVAAAQALFAFQCLPGVDLTFSWAGYLAFFLIYLVMALYRSTRSMREVVRISHGQRIDGATEPHDVRPLIVAAPMVAILVLMALDPSHCTLLYLMPLIAAQPMFFGSYYKQF